MPTHYERNCRGGKQPQVCSMPPVGHPSNNVDAGYNGTQETSRTATSPRACSLAEGQGQRRTIKRWVARCVLTVAEIHMH